MPWSVEYDSELGVIQCVNIGRVVARDFKKATLRALALATEHKTNLFLVDDSKLESGISKSDIYEMPLFYDQVNATRRSRMAIVLPANGQIRKDVLFYETVCNNRGWFVKCFDSRQKSVDWLLRKSNADFTRRITDRRDGQGTN